MPRSTPDPSGSDNPSDGVQSDGARSDGASSDQTRPGHENQPGTAVMPGAEDPTPGAPEASVPALPGADDQHPNAALGQHGAVQDVSEALGLPEGAPRIHHPAPMFWLRSLTTGEYFPAFDLGRRDELENNGCEIVDQGPAGLPAATGMAGTGLLA